MSAEASRDDSWLQALSNLDMQYLSSLCQSSPFTDLTSDAMNSCCLALAEYGNRQSRQRVESTVSQE